MKHIFGDTSFWFPLAVRADRNHQRTAELAGKLQDEGAIIFLSTQVLAETQRLIMQKLGIDAGHRFLTRLFQQVEQEFAMVLPVSWDHIIQARKILIKYGDQAITLTDACSVVLMNDYSIPRIASFDNHFRILGLEVLP
jgi:predicted nucleic acid-binding protein